MIIIINANCMFIMTMGYIAFGHDTHLMHMSLMEKSIDYTRLVCYEFNVSMM